MNVFGQLSLDVPRVSAPLYSVSPTLGLSQGWKMPTSWSCLSRAAQSQGTPWKKGNFQGILLVCWEYYKCTPEDIPCGNLPGGPLVTISSSSAEGVSSIPGLGAEIPQAFSQKTKTENRSSFVTNSIKTLTMVHIVKTKIIKDVPCESLRRESGIK